MRSRKEEFTLLPTLELMEGGGKYTQWVKAACSLMGQECGAPRSPLRSATAKERARLREAIRQTVFDAGSLFRPYHSVNTDVNKRIRYLSS